MLYVAAHRKGVAMLTGEVGCGKTTVAKALMDYLNQDKFRFHLLSNPALDPLDLIKAILLNFGIKFENGTKPVLLNQLTERLIKNALTKPPWMNSGCCSTCKQTMSFSSL
ncbi:MAG: AAA family ATPase [Planctomycetota bacterium]